MNDNVPGPAGSAIVVDDIAQIDSSVREMPVSKIRLGDEGVDGGNVSRLNALPTSDMNTETVLGQILAVLLAIDSKLASMSDELPFNEEG